MTCREHALSVQEPYGVWGGLSESDRREILEARRRATS
jgi:WhiB family redox-sensing transcriptional regulator